jgi:osmotically inducible lipoprotein OsmB
VAVLLAFDHVLLDHSHFLLKRLVEVPMGLSHFKPIRNLMVAVALAVPLTMSACSGQPLTTREKGTLGGGAIGAGGGALIGLAVGHPLAGAAIGGVVGAGTGFAVGNHMQNEENRHNSQEVE